VASAEAPAPAAVGGTTTAKRRTWLSWISRGIVVAYLLLLPAVAAFPSEGNRLSAVGSWMLVGSLGLLMSLGVRTVWAARGKFVPALRHETPVEAAARRRAEAQRAAEAEHAKTIRRLEKEHKKHVERVAQELERTRREHQKALKRAEKDLQRASSPPPLIQTLWPTVRLYEDRVETPDGTRPLTPQLEAAVDTAGNFAVGGRSTLTRMAGGAVLGGGLGLMVGAAAKKDVDKDKRELYLLITDPGWATVVKFKADQGEKVRRLAQQINIAARNVESAKAARRRTIAGAEEQLRATMANTSGISAASDALEAARAVAEQELAQARSGVPRLAGPDDA
jgi:hypothetical protein